MLTAFPLYVGNSGCDYHRVRLPFMYSQDWGCTYSDFKLENLLSYLSVSELVVWNRASTIPLSTMLQIREKHGMKIVVDLDDWIELPPHHPSFKHYKESGARLIIENLKAADLVTVTTERLAEKVRPLVKNVHVIPNALPFGHDQFSARPEQDKDLFEFVYAGQSSHLEDITMMTNALRGFKSDKAGFVLAGYTPGLVTMKMDIQFSKLPNYRRLDSLPLDKYMSAYDTVDCSLVPLLSNSFNQYKSNLKLLEAAAKKIPAIVSHVPPYSDDTDAPVLWVKHKEDWQKHVKYLSENRSAAEDYGQRLFEWANRKYNLFKWNIYRFALYKELVLQPVQIV